MSSGMAQFSYNIWLKNIIMDKVNVALARVPVAVVLRDCLSFIHIV